MGYYNFAFIILTSIGTISYLLMSHPQGGIKTILGSLGLAILFWFYILSSFFIFYLTIDGIISPFIVKAVPFDVATANSWFFFMFVLSTFSAFFIFLKVLGSSTKNKILKIICVFIFLNIFLCLYHGLFDNEAPSGPWTGPAPVVQPIKY